LHIILFLIFIDNDGKVTSNALAAITLLKKLCAHPDLILDKINAGSDGFENSKHLLPLSYIGAQAKYFNIYYIKIYYI